MVLAPASPPVTKSKRARTYLSPNYIQLSTCIVAMRVLVSQCFSRGASYVSFALALFLGAPSRSPHPHLPEVDCSALLRV